MAINTKEFYDVDYENIKQRLKSFLQTQTVLKDYNFEGSAISTWLNLISYCIYYINTIANFVSNELFIASAQIDENIYKSSYQLNYLPERKTSPHIKFNVSRIDESISVIIPKFTNFTMGSINLVTLEEYDSSDFTDVIAYQGEIVTLTHEFQGEDFETIILDDRENIDWNYFHVYVNGEEWTSVYEDKNYNQAKNFFIRYLDNFEVRFDRHNGFFSIPEEGDIVTIVYLRTNGSQYNSMSTTNIEIKDEFEHSNNLEITTIGTLIEGKDEESLESISNHAPLFYTSAGRCVTEDDYNYRITKSPIYEYLTDMIVWSGHRDAVDYNENPIEKLTNTSKLDKGFYIYSGYERTIINSDEDDIFNEYTQMSEAEKENLEAYFDNYRFMQIFGKYRLPNFLVLKPYINFTYKKGIAVEIVKLKEDLFNFTQKYIGFKKHITNTDIINFMRNNYDYINYIKVEFKNHALASKPFTRLKLESIANCRVDNKVMVGEAVGTIKSVDVSLNTVIVSRDNDEPFTTGTATIYEPDGITLLEETECEMCFNKLIIRLNKYVKDFNTFIDGKYLAVKGEYFATDKTHDDIIFKEAESLEDLWNEEITDEDKIGYINYIDGYIEFDDKFTWSDYSLIPILVNFLDNNTYRKDDISVVYETALDFQNSSITYTEE